MPAQGFKYKWSGDKVEAVLPFLKNFFKIYFYLFIWLWHVGSLSFVAACGIYTCGMWTLGCSMWDPVPWPGIELGPPALGGQSLSHLTTREVPALSFMMQPQKSPCITSTVLHWLQQSQASHPIFKEKVHRPHISVGGVLYCCCLVSKSYPTLCDLMECSPPGSSVHRISQAGILQWVSMLLSLYLSSLE